MVIICSRLRVTMKMSPRKTINGRSM